MRPRRTCLWESTHRSFAAATVSTHPAKGHRTAHGSPQEPCPLDLGRNRRDTPRRAHRQRKAVVHVDDELVQGDGFRITDPPFSLRKEIAHSGPLPWSIAPPRRRLPGEPDGRRDRAGSRFPRRRVALPKPRVDLLGRMKRAALRQQLVQLLKPPLPPPGRIEQSVQLTQGNPLQA